MKGHAEFDDALCIRRTPEGTADWRRGVAGLDCSCKQAALLLASQPLLGGTTKPFSTANVMQAGQATRFFGHNGNGSFLPSQVMQAEKTFPSSFMNRPSASCAVVSSIDMNRRVVASRDLAGLAPIM